ncbi:hypothetical protein SAMN02746041_00563 [Desulfacinum hydrothermale DSM 13146]|uniref:Uncharacterized protein n=1 Tax=Desulfacinum hydrothermale DSM 13146 TaxID=1121390 RepID=A0A1W1X4M4_9BACT|nr:hypothetical protein [Desulfacinum hydrothermale]SMC18856.1 hypothetical protein SAMN02746041_00563 [Desulfacinum hydrothermale DSM 13146]
MGQCARCGKETTERYCERCRSEMLFDDGSGGLPDCFDWAAGRRETLEASSDDEDSP